MKQMIVNAANQSETQLRNTLKEAIGNPTVFLNFDHDCFDSAEIRFKTILDIAQLGVPSAQNAAGIEYENGQNTPKDLELAEKWFKRAYSQGYSESGYHLGRMFLESGKAEKIQKGIEYLEKLNESPSALFLLATTYILGKVVKEDSSRGMRLLEKAAKYGHGGALAILATTDLESGNWKGFFTKSKAAAEANHPAGYVFLAQAYTYGVGTEIDLELAAVAITMAKILTGEDQS